MMDTDRDAQKFFSELESRLAGLEPKDVLKIRRDRWLLGSIGLGVVMTIPSTLGIRSQYAVWLTIGGLLLQFTMLAVLAWRQLRDVAADLNDSKRKFALELDNGFAEDDQTLKWIRSYPLLGRQRRHAYLLRRLQAISERFSLVFGAVDKLGILPLLCGVLLQVRVFTHVSLWMSLFAVALMLLYLMALWISGTRMQIRTYVRLLHAAEEKPGISASPEQKASDLKTRV